MKTIKILSIPAIISIILALAFKPFDELYVESENAKIGNLSDGIYEGYSRSVYTSENFWGHAKVKVINGKFTDIWFTIRDSTAHESVDSLYGVKHYSDNAMYMQQCVDDGNGIKNYPKEFIRKQNVDEVDAVTGATWSYRIFKASVQEALKKSPVKTVPVK